MEIKFHRVFAYILREIDAIMHECARKTTNKVNSALQLPEMTVYNFYWSFLLSERRKEKIVNLCTSGVF